MDIVRKIMTPTVDRPDTSVDTPDISVDETDNDIYINDTSSEKQAKRPIPKKNASNSRKSKMERALAPAPTPAPAKNDEVELLRREIEDMKFYQELEQTEYKEMKKKMQTYEKQMKAIEKQKEKESRVSNSQGSSRANRKLQSIEEDSETLEISNIDTVDLIASRGKVISSSGKGPREKDFILHKKLLKRDAQIQQLRTKLQEKVLHSKESSGKLNSLAKEYEHRLKELEILKDEEIEDIKDHYKQILESLAKQVQKVGKQHNEVVKKNADLRSMMDEMRSDMSTREKELERKIKVQLANMKKSDFRLNKVESKLDVTGSKYAYIKNELADAMKANEVFAARVKELETKYDKDITELEEKAERDLKDTNEIHEREIEGMRLSAEGEVAVLTEKLVDLEKLFDEEAAEHDSTMNQLKEKEDEVKGLIRRNEALETSKKALEEKISFIRKQLDDTREKLQKTASELGILTDARSNKSKKMQRQSEEIENMRKTIHEMKDSHSKESKIKDIEFVKARKKWQISEEKLKGEIEELKNVLAKVENVEETAAGKLVINGNIEDKKKLEFQSKLIEQLKADKASLQMTIATLNGKQNTNTAELERELTKTKRLLAVTNYKRELEKKMSQSNFEHLPRSHVGDEKRQEEEAHDDLQYSSDESNLHASAIDEDFPLGTDDDKSTGNKTSKELPLVSLEESSLLKPQVKVTNRSEDQPISGLTSQNSYRMYLRNRKFSKKNVVNSE